MISDCVCKEGFFVDQLEERVSGNESGPEYDFLRANNLTFRTWKCTRCPENAVCAGTTDGLGWESEHIGQPRMLPIGCSEECTSSPDKGKEAGKADQGSRGRRRGQANQQGHAIRRQKQDCIPCKPKVWIPAPPYARPEYWALESPQFRTAMFECNNGFCKGGAQKGSKGYLDGQSACNDANSGRMCAQCAESPAHFKFVGTCTACPSILINVLQVHSPPWSMSPMCNIDTLL